MDGEEWRAGKKGSKAGKKEACKKDKEGGEEKTMDGDEWKTCKKGSNARKKDNERLPHKQQIRGHS